MYCMPWSLRNLTTNDVSRRLGIIEALKALIVLSLALAH